MAIKKGMKVVIAKNLGPKNEDDTGYKDDYYFPDANSIDDTPLGSKGTVLRVEGNKVYVELEDSGDEYPFHKNELKFPGQNMSNDQLGRLPQQYVFGLASQMPIFLINDRVYSLDGSQGSLRSNFFQASDNGHSTRRGLVESATLASLEELTRAHHLKEFDKTERKYLQEVVEERSHSGEWGRYELVDFIVNEVFPYFRGDGQNSSKISQLLGVRTADVGDKKPKSKSQKPTESREETFVSKLIEGIEKEKFQVGGDEERKTRKLDALLGYDPRWDVTEFPKDYDPTSILGKILEGRNVAVVDNVFYNLVWTNSGQHRRVLNIDGKNYALVSPKPLVEVKARYDFELSKSTRVDALRNKLTQDEQLRKLAQRNVNLGSLVKRQEYSEGDFGFIKDDDSAYWVFLQVPKHVIKMPDDYEIEDDDYDDYDKPKRSSKKKKDRYYLFDKVRVAVRIFANKDGDISYDTPPITVEDYSHPFSMDGYEFGEICLGHYRYGKLSHLKKGEAVARLLTDTRTTLMAGYTRGNTPASAPLEEFEDNRITLSDARRRNLPIANVNLEKGRRRR